MIITCPICKKEFERKRNNQKYCSIVCSSQGEIIIYKEYYQKHKDKIKTYSAKYKENHKQKIYDRYISSSGIYHTLKGSAKARNIYFNISKEEFINWYDSQKKKCYYCERTLLQIQKDIYGHNKRFTIDRRDNSRGYELDNIVLACYRCNDIKGCYFTEQEMLEIGKIIKKKVNQ
jgi:hypothetical protein